MPLPPLFVVVGEEEKCVEKAVDDALEADMSNMLCNAVQGGGGGDDGECGE